MKRVLRWMISLVVAGAVVTGVVYLLIHLAPEPPVDEMDDAREMLSKAFSSKAGTYSKKLYSEARADYDSAMEFWKKENERFIYFRDYEKVMELAKSASEKARKATQSSIANSTSLKTKLREKIDTLNKTSESLESLFGRYPLSSELRNRISNGRMLLKEGEVAYGKGQYLQANRKITDSEYLLVGVYENATSMLREYFKSYSTWKRWAQNAISESKRSGTYAIIVDKFSRKCYIYLSGVKKYEFNAELGRNWVGYKRKMGDKATPEGIYKIVRKYQGRETPYYKALAIDYPNADDKERFRSEIAKGTLPSSARIGNGIEIHGGGGKGVDWTEGCIALKNADVDIVYNLVKVGTTVTIVGSLKEIDDVLN
ncbi:MAG: L,D-transpeptidase [Bacteroidales bacterium]